jgi:DNA-binding XRE family transcriptional regulator
MKIKIIVDLCHIVSYADGEEGGIEMEKEQLSEIRRRLGKTQTQMAQLLGVSGKAVKSFEQGWRRIPTHVERQALFLLASATTLHKKMSPCWVLQDCSSERRRNCPAWEYQIGNLCWFINGTVCKGEVKRNWEQKMAHCLKCETFKALFPSYGSL